LLRKLHKSFYIPLETMEQVKETQQVKDTQQVSKMELAKQIVDSIRERTLIEIGGIVHPDKWAEFQGVKDCDPWDEFEEGVGWIHNEISFVQELLGLPETDFSQCKTVTEACELISKENRLDEIFKYNAMGAASNRELWEIIKEKRSTKCETSTVQNLLISLE